MRWRMKMEKKFLGNNKPFKFFLGGDDAEMRLIRQHLEEAGIDFVDAGLGWGAKASAYGQEAFAQAERDGFIPVLVELEVDCDLPEKAVVVDHHGDRADESPAILQVLSLLGQEPNRWDLVVAANDAGWYPGLMGEADIPGMGRLTPPASEEEMKKVRFTGYSDEIMSEVNRALLANEEFIGPVRVVRMAHSKCGPVGDSLAIPAILKGVEIPQYIVFSEDGETNFSGDGALCAALSEKFPKAPAPWNPEQEAKCFSGGAGYGKAGETAFWGGYSPQGEILSFIEKYFKKA